MNNPDYQVVYGVGLLDDIHNYFPSLLYDHGRFQTLPQVLSYVRNQMNTRFNLFSYGASLHRAANPTAQVPVVVPPSAFPTTPTPRASRTDNAAALLLALLGVGNDIRLIPSGIGQNTGQNADIWASFNAPVVVTPSAEVIGNNTEIIGASTIPLTQNTCTVCQDLMRHPEECRRLRPCQHSFHRGCIDEWFRRSVFCPTCRHDIRNPTPSPRLGATSAPVQEIAPIT